MQKFTIDFVHILTCIGVDFFSVYLMQNTTANITWYD
jgi:hypothetical protein